MRKKLNVFEPRWLLVVSFFVSGTFLGILGTYILFGLQGQDYVKIHSSLRFKHINPLLAVDINNASEFYKNTSLEFRIKGLISQYKKDNKIIDAAIYYRDIDPGNWLGINELEKFSPGKLLKIPVMITYYKLAESDPELLNEKLTFRGPHANYESIFPELPDSKLKIGQTYTKGELIDKMIIDSNNDAANLLFDNVDKETVNEVFSDLAIDFKENKETIDFIPLKIYSLFFRILYNATYLSREYSEKALALLIKADNTFGLFSQIPKNIETANRYGFRSFFINGKKAYEIYDCGITYYPSHPYLLCAFTQSYKTDFLEKIISDLGAIVYQETTYKYK